MSALSRGTETQHETPHPGPKEGPAKGSTLAGSNLLQNRALCGELTGNPYFTYEHLSCRWAGLEVPGPKRATVRFFGRRVAWIDLPHHIYREFVHAQRAPLRDS